MLLVPVLEIKVVFKEVIISTLLKEQEYKMCVTYFYGIFLSFESISHGLDDIRADWPVLDEVRPLV